MTRLQNASLSAAWAALREHARRRRIVRMLVARLAQRQLLRAVLTWRRLVTSMCGARRLLDGIITAGMRAAFNAWRSVSFSFELLHP